MPSLKELMPTDAAIRRAILAVADSYGGVARDTIMWENERKHLREVRDILKSGPDAAVLDLGGGVGVNLLILRQLGHTGRLLLVERFDEYDEGNRMGSRATALRLLEASGVDVVQVDFWPDCNLPLEPECIDVACCYDVLEHLPGHPLRQLAELKRLLRNDGRILISAPNAASLMKRLKLLAGRQPYSSYDEWIRDTYFEHFREYLREEYEDLLRRAGFDDVRSEYSAVIPLSRSANRYHRRRHWPLSPVVFALHLNAAIELLVPSLRHTVYAEGVKRQSL
jgi:SAM-dependent methyltransferase